MFRTLKRSLVFGLALALLGASAVTALAKSGGDSPPSRFQFAPAVGSLPAIPGSSDRIIATLASRFPAIANARLATESIPPESSGPPTSALFIQYDLQVQTTAGPAIARAMWEATVFAGAVADELVQRHLPAPVGADGTLVTPDGQREHLGGGIGGAVHGQVFNAIPTDFAQTMSSNGRALGLTRVRTSVGKGLQDVVNIDAATDSPSAAAELFVHGNGLERLLGGSPSRYEATFVTVVDAAGHPVVMVGTAPRAAAGTLWVNPELGVEVRGHAVNTGHDAWQQP